MALRTRWCAIGVKAGQASVALYEKPLCSLAASTLLALSLAAGLVIRPQWLGLTASAYIQIFFHVAC
jgi:ABC-type transport system involved in multi-copper enzyme maturation permease subunit